MYTFSLFIVMSAAAQLRGSVFHGLFGEVWLQVCDVQLKVVLVLVTLGDSWALVAAPCPTRAVRARPRYPERR